MTTLIPAFGRDYKTAKAAKEDFIAGKDFIIADMFHQYDGKPVNREQLTGQTVQLRFCNKRKTTTIKA